MAASACPPLAIFRAKLGGVIHARRDFIRHSIAAAAAAMAQSQSKAAGTTPGMPGPFPGRVVAAEHPGCIVNNTYQAGPIRQMMQKGMMELTGAPSWTDAWRKLFTKGDVVAIKV